MANAPYPGDPGITAFWGWGFRLELIGLKFLDVSNRISGIPYLGAYLRIPFYIVGDWFLQARDKAWEANGLILRIQGWVEGIVNGDTFRQLLTRIRWHVTQFLDDPSGWVRDRIRDVSGDLWSIILNARAWIEIKVGESFPFISQMRIDLRGWFVALASSVFGWGLSVLWDPIAYILGVIRSHLPGVWAIVHDPTSYIVGALVSRWPFLGSFFNNPIGELIRLLALYNPDLGGLLADPRGWLGSHLCEVLGVPYRADLGVALSVLWGLFYRLSIGAGFVLDAFEGVLCGLILRFM